MLSGRTLSQGSFKFRGGAGAGLSGPPCVKVMVQDPKNAKQAWCHSLSLASKARAVGAFYSSWGMTGRGIKRTWKPPHHLGLRDESQPLKGLLTKKRFRKRWSLPVPAPRTPKRSNFLVQAQVGRLCSQKQRCLPQWSGSLEAAQLR